MNKLGFSLVIKDYESFVINLTEMMYKIQKIRTEATCRNMSCNIEKLLSSGPSTGSFSGYKPKGIL